MTPATIIVGIIVLAVFVAIVVKKIVDMKHGKHDCSCGGNCGACGGCGGACQRPVQKKEEDK